jgi:hypothetical protein
LWNTCLIYNGYAEADPDLEVDCYLEVDKYEVEMLKSQSNLNEGTATTSGDGEEDADDAAVEVGIPVDLAEHRENHKRLLQPIQTILKTKQTPT